MMPFFQAFRALEIVGQIIKTEKVQFQQIS